MSSISPMRRGQTLPWATWTFRDTYGNVIPMIAGTAYTLYIYNPATYQAIVGTGTWDTSNETSGVVTYKWAAADSAMTGEHQVFVGYVPPASTDQGYTQPVQWVILPLTGQQ
jgi:hypothetical protein